MFDHFIRDLRFGARLLLRAPGVTALVVVALALGIGANSAMFSVMDALLLHPLRFPNSGSLVVVRDRDSQGQLHGTSAANFLDWRRARSLNSMAAWAASSYVLTGGSRPVQISGARVTANIFQMLGVMPAMGRTFLPGEDGLGPPGQTAGAASVGAVHRVAVISNGLWRDALGSDPYVLGRTIRLSEVAYEVIGVMPAGFELLDRHNQIWAPAVLNPARRDYRYLSVLARSNGSREQSAAEMSGISHQLAEAYPDANRGWHTQVDELQEALVDRSIRNRLLLLFAAVGMVLLLACTNVASLLLARSAARSREIALRVSLGATRGRLVSQLLTESVLLGFLGGALGLLLAALLIEAAPGFIPANATSTSAPIALNPLVVAFTLGLSIVTGLLFGLAPALAVSSTSVQEVLQDSSRGSTGGPRRQFFRQIMVTFEVAVALILLAGATLMLQSMRKLSRTDLGVNIQNVLTLRMFLPATTYKADRSFQFTAQVLERVKQLPGVEQAGLGSALPLRAIATEIPVELESAPPGASADMPGVTYASVSPGYFTALGIRVAPGGRDFSSIDTAQSPPVTMVNEAFVRRYLVGEPVGARLRIKRPMLGSNGFTDSQYVQIIGVVGNVTLDEVGAPPKPILYAPLSQNVWSTGTFLAVRTRGEPGRLADAIQSIVRELDPNQPVDQVSTLAALFDTQFAAPRFQFVLMSAFAGLALALAVVGIYGVNSYAVTQRQREIGVRMALGATPSHVLIPLVAEGMKFTFFGIVIGVLGAMAMGTVLSSVLVGVTLTNPIPLMFAALLLSLVAAIACYIPARRATHTDPAITLRQE